MPYSDEFKRFFQFTHSERKGFFVLALISLVLIIFLQIDFLPNADTGFAMNQSIIDTTVLKVSKDVQTKPIHETAKFFERTNKKSNAFQFIDPNQADQSTLEAIGIYPNIAQRILKYRAKGGRFKAASDMKKIFGFTDKLYNKVSSSIKIDTTLIVLSKNRFNQVASAPKAEPSAIVAHDINKISFKTLFLLLNDSQMASNILKYKVALGGYYDLGQLNEVPSLSDSALQILQSKCLAQEATIFRKHNLNLAEAYELRRHPYIKNKLAQLIVAYRQNKPFITIEDLMKLPLVDQALFDKLKHYVFVTPNG